MINNLYNSVRSFGHRLLSRNGVEKQEAPPEKRSHLLYNHNYITRRLHEVLISLVLQSGRCALVSTRGFGLPPSFSPCVDTYWYPCADTNNNKIQNI